MTLCQLHHLTSLITDRYDKLTYPSVYTAPHHLKMEADLPVFNHTDLPCESCATLVEGAKVAKLLIALWAKKTLCWTVRALTETSPKSIFGELRLWGHSVDSFQQRKIKSCRHLCLFSGQNRELIKMQNSQWDSHVYVEQLLTPTEGSGT